MKRLLAIAAMLLSFTSVDPNVATAAGPRVLQGSPASIIVTVPGTYTRRATAMLADLSDGSIGIVVRVNYGRGWPTDGMDFAPAVFRLSARALEHHSASLYWVEGGRRILLARRTGWSSAWILSEGVKIQHKVERVPSEHAFDQYRVSAALVF